MENSEENSGVSGVQNNEADSYPSPINIHRSLTTPIQLPKLEWKEYEVTPKKMIISNTGHTVVINGIWEKSRPSISGGPLNGLYSFSQLHFHWPSEHRLSGMRFPLEMHAVYFKSNYLTADEALLHNDGILVIVYLFQRTDEINKTIDHLLESLPEIINPATNHELPPLPLNKYCPVFYNDYFMYAGGLHDANSTRLLQWFIAKKLMTLSLSQLEKFQILLTDDLQPMTSNCRTIPPDNNLARVFYVNPKISDKPNLSHPSFTYSSEPSDTFSDEIRTVEPIHVRFVMPDQQKTPSLTDKADESKDSDELKVMKTQEMQTEGEYVSSSSSSDDDEDDDDDDDDEDDDNLRKIQRKKRSKKVHNVNSPPRTSIVDIVQEPNDMLRLLNKVYTDRLSLTVDFSPEHLVEIPRFSSLSGNEQERRPYPTKFKSVKCQPSGTKYQACSMESENTEDENILRNEDLGESYEEKSSSSFTSLYIVKSGNILETSGSMITNGALDIYMRSIEENGTCSRFNDDIELSLNAEGTSQLSSSSSSSSNENFKVGLNIRSTTSPSTNGHPQQGTSRNVK